MNLSELKETIAKASDDDNADLGETLRMMAAFSPLRKGFAVSDQDHAEQIHGWLIELSKFRTALPNALQVMEEMAHALEICLEDLWDERPFGSSEADFVKRFKDERAALTAYERFQADVMGEQ